MVAFNDSLSRLTPYLDFLSYDSKKKLISLFENESKILAIYLFGSVVKNKLKKESDLDFGILLSEDKSLSGMECLNLASEIESITKYRTDLGILSKKNLIYSKEAILSGVRIFDREKSVTDIKINLLLSMYYHFKEEMREIYNGYRIG